MSTGSRFLAWAVIGMNLLDGIFTLSFLQLGFADELNPVMAWAYEWSPGLFMGLKLLAVQTGVLTLLTLSRLPIARNALRLGAGVYAAIIAYHLMFLLRVWAR